MSKLKIANAQLKKYQNHLNGQPTAPEHKKRAFMLTKEQIEKLLSQTEKGLDAVRIYLGIEEVVGGFVTTAYAVGCERKGKKYEDYLPKLAPTSKKAKLSLAAVADEPYDGIEEPSPCPSNCAPPNDLNS